MEENLFDNLLNCLDSENKDRLYFFLEDLQQKVNINKNVKARDILEKMMKEVCES